MSDRCYTHKARSCRKCDTMQKHIIELTDAEREAVTEAATTGWRPGEEEDPLVATVARIKAEAAQEELMGALHPEFGTEWREPDGVIYKAVQEAVQAERERIAREIEKRYLGPDSGRHHDGREAADAHLRDAYDEGLEVAARIARGES